MSSKRGGNNPKDTPAPTMADTDDDSGSDSDDEEEMEDKRAAPANRKARESPPNSAPVQQVEVSETDKSSSDSSTCTTLSPSDAFHSSQMLGGYATEDGDLVTLLKDRAKKYLFHHVKYTEEEDWKDADPTDDTVGKLKAYVWREVYKLDSRVTSTSSDRAEYLLQLASKTVNKVFSNKRSSVVDNMKKTFLSKIFASACSLFNQK